jgi:arylsulfate sulfotransferase
MQLNRAATPRSTKAAHWKRFAVLLLVAVLTACGGDDASLSSRSDLAVGTVQAGVTQFIGFVPINGNSRSGLAEVGYTIEPKAGTVSEPVRVDYTISALEQRGYAGSDRLTLPVFGLYAGAANRIDVRLRFRDGSAQTLAVSFTTAPYVDPASVYDHPTILKARASGSRLGFDFFMLKSSITGPVVVDTDGEVRWIGTDASKGFVSAFSDNGIVIGAPDSLQITRQELDGKISTTTLAYAPGGKGFHHNIDPGKIGQFGELDPVEQGGSNVETTLVEFTPDGATVQGWDFAAILSDYMSSQGDDPTMFVVPGQDWFHMNSSLYDPSDDSIIVSAREDFIIKVDYRTGTIKWIFGDPTKYWHTFASLRAKALTLQPGGLYPIGQHSLSFNLDGQLMLFNDGLQSAHQPAGAPQGDGRAYSAVDSYTIDAAAGTVTEDWRFDYNQSIFSAVCSSVYEAGEKSLLIDYADATNGTTARLVGLDSTHAVVFDFQYPSPGVCATAWNAFPVPFDHMRFE